MCLILYFVRKFISILLISLYSVATLGASVQLHYCGEQLVDLMVSTNIGEAENDCCGVIGDDCSTNEKDDCCKDIKVKVLAAEEQLSSSIKMSFNVAILNNNYFSPSTFIKESHFSSINNFANLPPSGLWQNIPLYILFQQTKFGNC